MALLHGTDLIRAANTAPANQPDVVLIVVDDLMVVFVTAVRNVVVMIVDYLEDRDLHGNYAVFVGELDGVGDEVEYDLAVSALVTEDLHKVKLVDRVLEHWTCKLNFLEVTLCTHHTQAPLGKINAVEVLVVHCELIVGHLGLVHQVPQQHFHHVYLRVHDLELLELVLLPAHLILNHRYHEVPLIDNHLDIPAQLLLLLDRGLDFSAGANVVASIGDNELIPALTIVRK